MTWTDGQRTYAVSGGLQWADSTPEQERLVASWTDLSILYVESDEWQWGEAQDDGTRHAVDPWMDHDIRYAESNLLEWVEPYVVQEDSGTFEVPALVWEWQHLGLVFEPWLTDLDLDVPVLSVYFQHVPADPCACPEIPALDWAAQVLRPSYVWTPDWSKAQTIYQFVLTGSADGMTDITIPISSCQMRRRDGKQTYMSVVVPDYDAYADEILARPGGEMVFYKGVRFADDSTQVQEIARVDMELENLRMDKGPKSRSITMVGHKTVTTTDPNVVTLSGASYRNYSGGTRRYRCDVDLWLRPGDTAVIEGQDEQFQVGYISYTIGVGQEEMEIVEVEE